MEIQRRAQVGPVRMIALVLALAAAILVALAALGVRPPAVAQPASRTTPPAVHTVGVGKEPDTADIAQQSPPTHAVPHSEHVSPAPVSSAASDQPSRLPPGCSTRPAGNLC